MLCPLRCGTIHAWAPGLPPSCESGSGSAAGRPGLQKGKRSEAMCSLNARLRSMLQTAAVSAGGGEHPALLQPSGSALRPGGRQGQHSLTAHLFSPPCLRDQGKRISSLCWMYRHCYCSLENCYHLRYIQGVCCLWAWHSLHWPHAPHHCA